MSADPNKGPVALVTGAGGGIGRATAIALAEHGHRLALLGRSPGKLEATAAALPPGVESIVLEVDLTDDAACVDAIDAIRDRFGRLDVIVNNAGAASQVPIEETDAAFVRRMLDTNLVGPIVLVSSAWPMLVEHRGCVVNVSSMASIDPFTGFTAYAASKAGLDSLSRSIMAETGDSGVRAFTINPGIVETEMLRGLFDESVVPRDAALPPEAVAREIVACVDGRRDERVGRPHPLLPESNE